MKQKNILLVLTDQMRFDTIEALGNRTIRTPTLNGLVRNGAAFTRAYTNSPVCVPARYAMHTGQLPHVTDCVINETMPDNHPSFMEILQQAGYQTHGVGKMHFTFADGGAGAKWGFETRDISEEHPLANDDYKRDLERNGYDHVTDPHGIRSEMYYIPQPSQLPARLHNTTWVADRSIEFLNNRDQNRPFFLMTSFIKPHPPFENPAPWNKLYMGPEMQLPKRPPDTEQLLTFWNKVQNRYKYRDQGTDDQLVRSMIAAYYGAISFMDYNLGRLLDGLKEHKLMEDTLIVFTSDHGELLGDYNSYGKRCFLDSAARVPLIMVHPEADKGVCCDAPVSLVDLLPTFLQYAGIPTGQEYPGESLLDIAGGTSDRDMVIGQFHRGEYAMYMAGTQQFKYIYSAPDDKEFLFDLDKDPMETRNKANNLIYRHITDQMRSKLISQLKKDGYTQGINGDTWLRFPKKDIPEDPDAWLLYHDVSPVSNIPGYERNRGNFQSGYRGFEMGF